jgi:hypothetical protein
LHVHDAEDAEVEPQGLSLCYKIPTEYQSPSNRQSGDADDVTFNLPDDVVPASSIGDDSNYEISPAAEGTDLFESGQESVEDSGDAYVVVIQKIMDFIGVYDEENMYLLVLEDFCFMLIILHY